MASIQNVTAAASSATTAAAAGGPAAGSSSTDIQDRFLKLLVTQLKNQDPLNPMDNAQLTSQLSQISTVSGIEKLNTTMQSLSDSLFASQSMQATSLIGHSIYAEGSRLGFDGSTPAAGGINLAQAADSVKINVVGPSGNVVRQIDLGAQKSGMVGFKWDGMSDGGSSAAPGAYTFTVAAKSGTQTVPTTSLMSGQVSSVTIGSDGAHAIVKGIGDVSMQQIKQIM
jgi:flagellar basal-body rod modification protein FlgD